VVFKPGTAGRLILRDRRDVFFKSPTGRPSLGPRLSRKPELHKFRVVEPEASDLVRWTEVAKAGTIKAGNIKIAQ
jgi:hypothetical protein